MNYENHPQLDRIAADYVLGTMRGRARRRFEALIRQSHAARAAVDGWTHRLHLLSAGMPAPVAPSADLFQRIERRIAPPDRAAGGPASHGRPRTFWSWLQPLAGFALGVMMTWTTVGLLRPTEYQTRTSPEPRASVRGQTLRVVFAPETTLAQMRAALRSVQAGIVAGPTDMGVLTVGIDSGQSLERALATLRAQPGIRLVEPVDAPPAGTR